MELSYSYSFVEKAERDLDEILHYIAFELNNAAAARELAVKIFDCIDGVVNFPESGLLVENEFLPHKSIRRVLVDNYIIYYKPIEQDRKIYILRIIYGKRNIEDILKSL